MNSESTATQRTGLRSAGGARLAIGTAVSGHAPDRHGMPLWHDDRYRQVLAAEFSSLTGENQMKWEWLQPSPGEFDFAAADAIVDFAAAHGQQVRGHTLMWHNQNPAWITNSNLSAEQLRETLRDHIHTVVGRYAGRIQHWDVVNEIIDDDGQLRMKENPWLAACGREIIADAFTWAHEADPQALLFGNDFDVEATGPKSDAWYELLRDLRAEGVPVHGFGVQGHLDLSQPYPESFGANLQRFADLGLRTAITELDIRGRVADGGALSAEHQGRQVDWYRRVLRTALATPGMETVTVWGVLDEQSWVPGWFTGTGEALLMHGDYEPKAAYYAVQETLTEHA